MILKLGFVKKDSRFVKTEFYVIWGGILTIILASIYLLLDTYYLHEKNDGLNHKVTKLNLKLSTKKMLLKDAPSIEEFNALKKRIVIINKLAAFQGAGLSSVLLQLEEILPKKAYVTNLSYKPKRNEVLITVEAPSSNELTEMLQMIESSKHIGDVLLRRQSQKKVKGKRYLQFEMSLFLNKVINKNKNKNE